MRRSSQFAVVLAAALGLAGAAQGAVLTSASFAFPGRTPLGAFPPITGAGVGTSAGLGVTATLGSNVLQGTIDATGVTTAPPITQVRMLLTGHAAGSFVAGGGPGGGLGGPMTLGGAITANGYSGMVTLLRVPLSPVGQPGGFAPGSGAGGGTIVQVWGNGWTTGVQTMMVPATTVGGGTQTPRTVTATGADLRTASGAGALVLITPMFIRTNLGGADMPLFATLTLNYVPEPGTLLLIGAGIAGLALRERKRQQPS
jgi:hypothetical protein